MALIRSGASGFMVLLGLALATGLLPAVERGLGAKVMSSTAFRAAREVFELNFGTVFLAGIGFGFGCEGFNRGGLTFPWA